MNDGLSLHFGFSMSVCVVFVVHGISNNAIQRVDNMLCQVITDMLCQVITDMLCQVKLICCAR